MRVNSKDPSAFLRGRNATDDRVDGKWEASNEQWWDWYLSLACEDDGPAPALRPMPPLPDLAALAPADLAAELAVPYPVPSEAIRTFRRDGYVKLKQVCSPRSLLMLRREWEVRFARALVDTPAMRFPSFEMMWTQDEVAGAFVRSRRLAGIAAALLGADAVRLYHDNALSKLPGCGRTPWHYDAHHYPIDSDDVVTLWAPLQPTPREMGPLVFARGIDTWRKIADLPFSKLDDSYDRGIIAALEENQVELDGDGFDFGEVSFHHARSLHSAGPNHTDAERMALAVTYFEDGARLIDEPSLINGDYEKFMPGIRAGERIDSPLNPVLYERNFA